MNPTDDGDVVRVVLPALGSAVKYVKLAKSKAEDGRVSVRGVRRRPRIQLDRLKKDSEASEDDVERAEKHLDSTKAHTEQIDRCATKESELLTIWWRQQIPSLLARIFPWSHARSSAVGPRKRVAILRRQSTAVVLIAAVAVPLLRRCPYVGVIAFYRTPACSAALLPTVLLLPAPPTLSAVSGGHWELAARLRMGITWL